jgi:hypothetical protein
LHQQVHALTLERALGALLASSTCLDGRTRSMD